ncbi:hypothetical protein GCM10028803_55190 [Larkinella knui]|uniref:Cupin domain-containing protein n=1 Tax=Larkinella knui TaxID=2025310 RepID=A0A3P1CGY6_9BACT|nr:cupin domain-containing protein [Larkinella knui]RRB12286.1 cupin domain-containing protein [Larkinella knui]
MRLPVIVSITLFFSVLHSGYAQQMGGRPVDKPAIFGKGNRGPAETFTGTVWVNILAPNDSTYTTSVASVLFEPGARTFWHLHPAGQLLLVTDGAGYYQEQGKPIQPIHQGDVVKCLPNVLHWHGASPTHSLTHIAINPNTEKGIVVWKQAVTDQEYRK